MTISVDNIFDRKDTIGNDEIAPRLIEIAHVFLASIRRGT
jgi:hypothetical protein